MAIKAVVRPRPSPSWTFGLSFTWLACGGWVDGVGEEDMEEPKEAVGVTDGVIEGLLYKLSVGVCEGVIEAVLEGVVVEGVKDGLVLCVA
jgi:hypothetical protein